MVPDGPRHPAHCGHGTRRAAPPRSLWSWYPTGRATPLTVVMVPDGPRHPAHCGHGTRRAAPPRSLWSWARAPVAPVAPADLLPVIEPLKPGPYLLNL
ncbi:unnamed protein product [Arctogadus glacialis]